ncbi:alkyl hydroperoxide reductase subunit F [Brevibacterium paucivorans]|uniref:Alkyl hydroperoxide reductase subunit F n=1 Tax=Brevibacterium paucivorans TaxID=170994 RepID=A0ABS2SGD8_9MICO|nr:alkyl hydroperoxide reductase subunit F [Brevibacterium paucivorans]
MLDANLKDQLQTILTQKVTEDVVLASSLDDSKKSAEMAELLDEIAELSDRVTHERRDDYDERRPSFAIERPGADISIRFAGLPLGHEFSSLVLALAQVGGNPVKESDETIAAVKGLDKDLKFVTYMSLTCQNCPTVVQALNTMAVLNPRIQHVAVEGSTFQDEVSEKNIQAVPTIYLNGEEWGSGRMDIADFVDRLDDSAAERLAESVKDKDPFDVLVVGGGSAAVAASIYAARKGLRTGMVADRIGGQILDTVGIENFISYPYTEGPKLAAQFAEHMDQYDIDVIRPIQAEKLVPAETEGDLHTAVLTGGSELKSKTVVVATGARWRELGVPGDHEYRNKGVTFCPHCDGPFFKGKNIAVVGGGNSGIEAAIDLAGIVGHVTVMEFMDELKADEVLQRKLKSMDNVDIILSAASKEVLGDGKNVTGLQYEDRKTGELHELDVNGIFVQIGLLPNTEWVKGAVDMNGRGEIEIQANGATSVPGIFAAGDATTAPYKQIVTSLGAGATAALAAFDYLIRQSAPQE